MRSEVMCDGVQWVGKPIHVLSLGASTSYTSSETHLRGCYEREDCPRTSLPTAEPMKLQVSCQLKEKVQNEDLVVLSVGGDQIFFSFET